MNSILLGIIVLILSTIGYVAWRVFMGWKNLKFYKAQGVPTFFYPTTGMFQFYSRSLAENKRKSTMEFIKKYTNENKSGLIAVNSIAGAESTLLAYGAESTREYVLKEDSFNKVSITPELSMVVGLFYENGEEIIHRRSLFNKLFSYHEVETLAPKINELIKQSFAEFNKAKGIKPVGDGTEWTRVNLNEIYETVMSKIANLIIFGSGSIEDPENAKLMNRMHDLLAIIVKAIVDTRKNPFYILSPTISKALHLVPSVKILKDAFKEQVEIIKVIMKNREARPSASEDCYLDRVIQHNKQCQIEGKPTEKLSDQAIAGDFNLFVFAGTDTSQNTTKMSICHMAENPSLKQICANVCKEIYTEKGELNMDGVENSEYVDKWVKETLRLFNPVARQFGRIANKDLTFRGVKVRKGDYLMLLFTGMNFEESVFPKPNEFNLERFSKENEKAIPKYQFTPFSIGKRTCLGKYLGELMVKLLVTEFYKFYEFEKPADVEYYQLLWIVTMETNPILNIKTKVQL